MKFIARILITALSILIIDYFLNGVQISEWTISILVAVVLGFLNAIVKPILQILTIPITIFTLGLFLLVINAGLILLADKLVDGFHVNGFFFCFMVQYLVIYCKRNFRCSIGCF